MNLLERNGLLKYEDFINRTMIAARVTASIIASDAGSTPGALQLAGKIMRLPYDWAKVIAVGLVVVDNPALGTGTSDDPIGPNDDAFKYAVSMVVAELAARETVV